MLQTKNTMINKFFRIFALICYFSGFSQNYWQQAVDYKMNVEMNVEDYTYTGEQQLTYTNNSPETLHKVFYHLYFNAFQPGSEMAARVNNGKDKNTRFNVNIDSINDSQDRKSVV